MKLSEIHSSQNGYHKTSPPSGEVFVAAPTTTAFPSEVIPLAWPVLFYNLTRFTWADMRLIRLPQSLLVLATALWATGWLPGRWWATGFCLLLLAALQWKLQRWRQQDFVRFVASTPPTVKPQRLDPKQKIPVQVTGRFAVENKIQRFTWLPGFYRTFATREHALLCQATKRTFLWLARWPETEVGLWYIFFTPQVIQRVQWGALQFGRHSRPALAVTYLLPDDKTQRRRAETHTTVYLAFVDQAEGSAIFADLLVDLPDAALAPTRPRSSPQ
jgi:hypothetical protein